MSIVIAGVRFLNAREIRREFGFSASCLTKWRRKSRELGRRIQSRWRCVEAAGKARGPIWQWHYSEPDLQQIAKVWEAGSSDDWGLTEREAVREFKTSEQSIRQWANAGLLRTRMAFRPRQRRGVIQERIYSRDDLIGIFRGQNGSFLTTLQASKEFGWAYQTIKRWESACRWHPAGKLPIHRLWAVYRQKSGKVIPRLSPHVDRADCELIWRRLQDPERLDSAEWVSSTTAEQKYGINRRWLSRWSLEKCPLLGRRLKSKLRTSVRRKGGHQFRLYSVDDLNRLAELRCELPPPTTGFIRSHDAAAILGLPIRAVHRALVSREGPEVRCEKAFARLQGGRIQSVWHYHQKDVEERAEWLRKRPRLPVSRVGRSWPGRKVTQRETHERWRQWKLLEGLSHGRIAQRHFDQTGRRVTPDAVKKAIKRLPALGTE